MYASLYFLKTMESEFVSLDPKGKERTSSNKNMNMNTSSSTVGIDLKNVSCAGRLQARVKQGKFK